MKTKLNRAWIASLLILLTSTQTQATTIFDPGSCEYMYNLKFKLIKMLEYLRRDQSSVAELARYPGLVNSRFELPANLSEIADHIGENPDFAMYADFAPKFKKAVTDAEGPALVHNQQAMNQAKSIADLDLPEFPLKSVRRENSGTVLFHATSQSSSEMAIVVTVIRNPTGFDSLGVSFEFTQRFGGALPGRRVEIKTKFAKRIRDHYPKVYITDSNNVRLNEDVIDGVRTQISDEEIRKRLQTVSELMKTEFEPQYTEFLVNPASVATQPPGAIQASTFETTTEAIKSTIQSYPLSQSGNPEFQLNLNGSNFTAISTSGLEINLNSVFDGYGIKASVIIKPKFGAYDRVQNTAQVNEVKASVKATIERLKVIFPNLIFNDADHVVSFTDEMGSDEVLSILKRLIGSSAIKDYISSYRQIVAGLTPPPNSTRINNHSQHVQNQGRGFQTNVRREQSQAVKNNQRNQ